MPPGFKLSPQSFLSGSIIKHSRRNAQCSSLFFSESFLSWDQESRWALWIRTFITFQNRFSNCKHSQFQRFTLLFKLFAFHSAKPRASVQLVWIENSLIQFDGPACHNGSSSHLRLSSNLRPNSCMKSSSCLSRLHLEVVSIFEVVFTSKAIFNFKTIFLLRQSWINYSAFYWDFLSFFFINYQFWVGHLRAFSPSIWYKSGPWPYLLSDNLQSACGDI